MDFQIIIVALIILAAVLYAGRIFLGKVQAFKPKAGSCGSDCGCESKAKIKS
ncbi:MAG TPA: hypothetical protein VGC97_11095 [Pyrinomonadaceae bacterium]|jgi:hypothetical protein